FRDVTESSGIRVTGSPRAIAFVDYDHDGDLDLYVTRWSFSGRSGTDAGGVSSMLWRNNGNGTFTEVAEEAGLAARPAASGVVVSDLNNDRAIDFIVKGRADAPPLAFFNRREGPFEKRPMWPASFVGAVGMATLDFDKDGFMDVALTRDASPPISLWRNEG